MRRKSFRRTSRRTTSQKRKPLAFLRRPIVQLSILAIAAVVILVIALTVKK